MTSQDSGRQYKTFRGLQADLEPPEYQGRPGRSLHLFLGSNSLTSLSAHKNADGNYSGTLGLKRGGECCCCCCNILGLSWCRSCSEVTNGGGWAVRWLAAEQGACTQSYLG